MVIFPLASLIFGAKNTYAAPCVWSGYIHIGKNNTGFNIVIATGRVQLLFVKLIGNLCRTFPFDTEAENPLNNRCNILIGNNFTFGIIFVLRVAVGCSGCHTLTSFRFRFNDWSDFPAGIVGVESAKRYTNGVKS